jgi:hypothetical protein
MDDVYIRGARRIAKELQDLWDVEHAPMPHMPQPLRPRPRQSPQRFSRPRRPRRASLGTSEDSAHVSQGMSGQSGEWSRSHR